MLTFLNKYKSYVLGVVLAVIFWMVAAHYIDKNRQADQVKAEATLHLAQDSLHVALAGAQTRDQAIVHATLRADSAGKRALAAQLSAASIKATIPALRARLDSLLSDSAQTEDAALLYDAMDARSDSLESALTARATQVNALTGALDSAKTTIRSLTHAATAVDTAATAVVKTIKTSWFVKIAPKPGFGLALGFDQTGKPAAVVGVTVSWPR
jgi:predicted RNase H-like nuclease (RuvC/YqgF family)